MSLRLLHISDLHFGPPFLPAVGQALLRAANSLGPDIVVASGDFTQRARREQFHQAREFLTQLPDVPLITVPGNHDVPLYRVAERLKRPLALYQEYICAELNQIHRFDAATFVALDSTAPHRAISNGRLHLWQLDYCAGAFADAPPDAARIVVAHHHFAPAPDFERDQTMPGARRAINLFVDLGVEMILGGHLHRAYIGNSLDVYPGNHRDRGIIIVQCGTSTSRRGRGKEREKNSFNLITIETHMVHIMHYMYFEEDGEFAPLSRHTFPRPGRRFVVDP
jgi:3',5'-cyclic AMP phosphodiesterase CpdA